MPSAIRIHRAPGVMLLACTISMFPAAQAQQRAPADTALCARAAAVLGARTAATVDELMAMLAQIDGRVVDATVAEQNAQRCAAAKADPAGVASEWGITTPTMLLWIKGQTVLEQPVCRVRQLQIVGC